MTNRFSAIDVDEYQGQPPAASPTFEDNVTIGDKYGPAMSVKTEEEATRYFEACVEHTIRVRQKDGDPVTREEAEKIEQSNIGYYTGYCDSETAQRTQKLFRCAHPIFGRAT